ncbi:uncharacterized protein LOC134182062 [Corticium candelabrum]|uniref:uncharacterized protein LOC134182062 n=1 Tax=Corticium candelabrum TaxID=121492 RepID=UPI002E261C99|nr:uncharacterized protein LOC134182062 [Corticium candelabrum]XP_062505372.1 uncharacterized protein LOC134182062 [Corticium candelabrum]XP_062505373.1 uncharacterized protein LOC134182062 [Corticium candelabrum]
MQVLQAVDPQDLLQFDAKHSSLGWKFLVFFAKFELSYLLTCLTRLDVLVNVFTNAMPKIPGAYFFACFVSAKVTASHAIVMDRLKNLLLQLLVLNPLSLDLFTPTVAFRVVQNTIVQGHPLTSELPYGSFSAFCCTLYIPSTMGFTQVPKRFLVRNRISI